MSRAPLKRPPFWVRVAALLIDYALILGWMAVLAVVALISYAITGRFFDWLALGTAGAQVRGFALLVLPVGIYLFASEASSHHATVGKRVLRLQVVEASTGSLPSRTRVLVRTVVKLLPWEIAHVAVWNIVGLLAADDPVFPIWLLVLMVVANVLPLAYIAMVAFQKDGRGPHDLAAGTRVIRRGPSHEPASAADAAGAA
ncbi:RDD family protein [Microbacterium sp. LRZ72]|uniref:RDD family protein n=1 Tax=Microbacterium sp. LRZ72 TaxID=2942481 RepID=UPI0029B3DBBF|nr:RDD family protein [Microbacterium sp. LRZ72]MDX2375223.1 RDD family protein [Microbacterium sp. LRZ72]